MKIPDDLPPEMRPFLVRGDIGHGNDSMMSALEERGQDYLFKQRMTKRAKELVAILSTETGWSDVGQGWYGKSSELQLTGWSRKRRVVVMRRRRSPPKDVALPAQAAEGDQLLLGFSTCWSLDEQAVARAEPFDGKLTLLTNAPDLTPAETVIRYKALTDIERGFRVLKSDIEIAPVHHRLPDRIRAHALICFLALMLYRVMRMRLKAGEHSASPRTTLNLLSRIQKHTAHIGDHTFNTTSKTTPEQLDLFDALNLPRPT